MIKIRASDFGRGPVNFGNNWLSRPVEILVLALPLDLRRQNLTSTYARLWRLKSVPALKRISLYMCLACLLIIEGNQLKIH